jgi:hypothetical protein
MCFHLPRITRAFPDKYVFSKWIIFKKHPILRALPRKGNNLSLISQLRASRNVKDGVWKNKNKFMKN